MSSPDTSGRRRKSRPSRPVAAALAACALVLAGCQVRPLYGTGPNAAAGQSVVDELRRVAVEVKRERLDQGLMNALIFALRGGAPLEDPRYTLRLIVSKNETELAIRAKTEVPAAKLVGLQVTYTMTENVSGKVLANGTVYRTASYDFSSQRFANLRAARDAEDRAAKAAAEDIRLQLATVLATAG